MFNKFALVITGLMLTISSVGCCCLGGMGYGANYGNRGCAPCNNGCAPAGGGFYPPTQGAFYQGMDTSQTAYATGSYTQTAFAPVSTSAYVPTSTAMIPGAIQGQPIYNTAVVPMSPLQTY